MVWRNYPLTLYHGTVAISADDIQTNGISLAKCRPRRDFGHGFYTTPSYQQAATFANSMFRRMSALYRQNGMNPDPMHAAVMEFSADRNQLGQLDTACFVMPNDAWREFVMHCRSGGRHKQTGVDYELVYGPVSTNTYLAWPSYEQLSFHSDRAIRVLLAARLVARGRPGKPTL